MTKGFILVLSGPSGVGKGTVRNKIMEKRDDCCYSISVTTRKKRPGEEDKLDYYFLSEEEFKEGVDRGDFLEYACVHNHYYGTPKKEVEERIREGKIVLLEIDVQGAKEIKEKTDDAVFVFLMPPDLNTLKERIIKRQTESEDEIDERMKNAIEEIQMAKKYDYIIVNDEIEKSSEDLESILNAEKLRAFRIERNIL